MTNDKKPIKFVFNSIPINIYSVKTDYNKTI